ncbi:hypothetical protein LOCC1_G004739 [Lachnellula occidentalis]|uniref:Zn(2)-C6 fungal-type domain-containing protein n=1 Tax=Lachnellula occidentalis TaxID=215460 RepID=A0A8H8UA24_9HELO|nr:hypothetical protein LOCC1_G004739 [Lachnellula occidentalis]
MSTIDDDSSSSREEEARVSHIACHMCRRRKIRCGRELPCCEVCERTSQVCEYPAQILKPGPKIGSTQRSRKRRRTHRGNDNGPAISPNANLNVEPSTIFEGEVASTVAARKSKRRPAAIEDDGNNAQAGVSTTGSSQGRQTLSNREVDSQESVNERRSSINIQDLSFILHPAHEASTPEKNTSPRSAGDGLDNGRALMLSRASHALSVTPDTLERMVKIYFENMTAISILHEPTFEEKIQIIGTGSVAQVHALLAAVLAFSARFYSQEDHGGQRYDFSGPAETVHRPAFFLDLASKFADEALKECDEEAPPLCVVQALVLIAHGQLTQGVRGKAWRSLGTCVRLAYELNLHLVDAAYPQDTVDVQQWCDLEEERRVWWAIWEMDVFASTVRRCPTAVCWSQIETLLPVEDEHWFTRKPRASCFLEPDPVRRWKVLQDSGNHSPKAWYIIINSLMKDAQAISSPRGVPNLSSPSAHRLTPKSSKDQKQKAKMTEHAKEKMETLTNSVYCFTMALPSHLKYRNQYLGFDAPQPGQTTSSRQHHCGLYNIHMMTQLAKLMIHHYEIFSESAREGRIIRDQRKGNSGGCPTPSSTNSSDNLAEDQYFEAADEVLNIIRRSSENHIQWINNFLASTIWLASAVQLVRKEFGPPGTNISLIKSKFEVLNMTYKKCVSFWNIQTAMQRNLETLESQLEQICVSIPKKPNSFQPKVRRRPRICNDDSHTQEKEKDLQSDSRQFLQSENLNDRTSRGSSNLPSQQTSLPTNSPNASSNAAIAPMTRFQQFREERFQSHEQPQALPQHSSHQPQVSRDYLAPLSPALSTLDFMHFSSQTDKDGQQQVQYSDGTASVSPQYPNDHGESLFSGLHEGQFLGMGQDPLQGQAFGKHMDGWNSELPNYIDELLSGAYMY